MDIKSGLAGGSGYFGHQQRLRGKQREARRNVLKIDALNWSTSFWDDVALGEPALPVYISDYSFSPSVHNVSYPLADGLYNVANGNRSLTCPMTSFGG